eukprot:CAMPEP_0170473394 /NCGR_PEP_ID=MMETSP0123-20130129/15302_1 /TAXON_ID=182087 /ORGANISM="Favella ehrenbergii, Strain Fehren 1" /LENGTH=119 /DNA_ID=CAMNT_0010742375 /DNA_START=1519 /DNA_END=1876 /DNA_ORIENTATION=+
MAGANVEAEVAQAPKEKLGRLLLALAFAEVIRDLHATLLISSLQATLESRGQLATTAAIRRNGGHFRDVKARLNRVHLHQTEWITLLHVEAEVLALTRGFGLCKIDSLVEGIDVKLGRV